MPVNYQYLFDVTAYGADPTGALDSTAAVKAARDEAWANVQISHHRSAVFFPAGLYKLTDRTQIVHISLAGMNKLAFVGASGQRARLRLTGNSALGNWHMFGIDSGASDIEFRSLVLEMSGITNPDPGQQNHIFQVGTNCHDIRFDDCEFLTSLGDCIRLLGEFGQRTHHIRISGCRFLDFGRAGVSFQRWTQNVTLTGCYFRGGSDQQLDFEPTGATLIASSGSTASILKFSTGHFTKYGLRPGDHVWNGVERKMVRIVSIDSDTQITTTAGCTDWTGDTFRFPLHEGGHIIEGNQFSDEDGVNAAGILVALEEAYATRFVNNVVGGTLYATRVDSCLIAGNHFEWRGAAASGSLLDIRFESRNLTIADNTIMVRSNTGAAIFGINVSAQQHDNPTEIAIRGNHIVADTKTTAIHLLDVESCIVEGNSIKLNTPGDTTTSVGIFVGAVGATVKRAVVVNNNISAEQGGFLYGVDFSADRANITSCLVGGGIIDGCGTAIVFRENAGVFINPPALAPTLHEVGEINPPASRPWIQLAGVGGSAPTTNSRKPAVYWGSGTPEAVLTAGVGSLALCRDGGAGSCLYVKESGTGNIGWVNK
jgi:Pectate lyase superfamily protein